MKLKKFSLKEKDWRIPIGQLPPCYQKERTFVFWRSREKKVSLYAIHISFTRVYS